jgi:hypothetical protein
MCNNFQQLHINNNVERDVVAQSGNYQRTVGRCETVAQAECEFPSGVGEIKQGNSPVSNFIRVRPLQRRTIQPYPVAGGRVVGEVVMATLRQNKVVTRASLEASRPYASAFSKDMLKALMYEAGRGVFCLPESSNDAILLTITFPPSTQHMLCYPHHWRGWQH